MTDRQPIMRLKPTPGQRWRVSVYPPGVVDNLPDAYPATHKASRDQQTAQRHFDRFAALIGGGRVGRVIMHQGKLYTGFNQYLHDDTQWWPDKYRPAALAPTSLPPRRRGNDFLPRMKHGRNTD